MSYGLTSEVGGRQARVHINRLKKIAEDHGAVEAGDPQQGVWPDVRRVIRSIIEARGSGPSLQFKTRSRGRTSFTWVNATDLPDVVTTAFKMAARERALCVTEGHQGVGEDVGGALKAC